ncbi:MAG: hypothetical protein ACOH18_03100 [Candidatus Saccharimonadaceae bacterium]
MANAVRSVIVSTSTASTTATFTETAALNSTYGLLAMVRQLNATAPTTPAGWTLLPGSGAQGTMWTGMYARRGDGAANSITLDGPTASRVITLVAFAGIYEDVFWEDPSSATLSSGTSLSTGNVTVTTDYAQAVAYVAVGGTPGGSGFSWNNSFILRTGASGSSSGSWAEYTVPNAGVDVSTTATWTSTYPARILLVVLRTTDIIVPTETYPKNWTGAGLADNTTVTTNTNPTNEQAFTVVSGSPLFRIISSVRQIEVANTATSINFGWNGLDLPTWQAQFYFRLAGSASASGVPIFEARTASGVLFRLALSTADNISLLDSSLAYVAQSPTITKTTERYCISLWGTASTGAVHVRIYDSVGTPIWSRDATVTNVGNFTTATFGRNSATASGPSYYSSMQIGDSAQEIPGNFATPPTPSFPKEWSGKGVAASTNLSTTVIGTGDAAFNIVNGTMPVRVAGALREIEIPNTTTSSNMRWNGLDMSTWQARFYFRLTGSSATSAGIPIFEARTAAGLLFRLVLGTNDSISLLNSSAGFINSGPVLVKGTGRYRISVWGQAGTDLVHVRLYNPAGSLVWTRNDAVGTSTNLAQVIFGRNGVIAFGPAYFSDIAVSNVAAELPANTADETFGYVLESNMTTLTPVGLAGMLDTDLATIIPISGYFSTYTQGSNDPVTQTPGYRMPFDQPYAADAPHNVPIATTATYEAASDTKTQWLRTRGTSGTINYTSWSINIGQASVSDPLATITNKTTGAVLVANVRIPAGFQPPLGSGSYTPDAASVIVDPNGYTAYELYKFEKFSDTDWRATRLIIQDLRASGITSGVRASGMSLALGLIRKKELQDGAIHHALAFSMPESGLKLTPTSADGELSPNGKAVWPANQQDTQVPGSLEYIGPIPMGSYFAIPSAVNVETMGLSGAALYVTRAAQQYGVYVSDRSSSIAIYTEPSTLSADATAMRTAWRDVIMPNLRRVTNNTSSTIGGGVPGATRIGPDAAPFDPSIPAM